MLSRMFKTNARYIAGAGAVTLGLAASSQSPTKTAESSNSTSEVLLDISSRLKNIERDLGISGSGASASKSKYNNYPVLTPKHKSLMAKHLTPEIYDKLKDRKTANGYTIDQAIQTGIDTPHLGVGVVAGDEESYQTFKELMDPVIEGWHGYKPTDTHKTDIDPSKLRNGKIPDSYVISTRIRAGRSVRGLALPPGTTRGERREVERVLSKALSNLTKDLAGKYYPLSKMTKDEEQQLIDDHFLFQKPGGGTLLTNAGAARDWPDGRGIFHNNNKTFLVWVNEEDHMRVIAMQNGGNIQEVFDRFSRGVSDVEKVVKGEGREYIVMIKFPQLSKESERFYDLCSALGLQARGSKGEHSPPGPGGVYDVSNKARIGFSEVELVQTMIDGIWKLVELEEDLKKGRSIDKKVAAILK
ncbi:Creatine kinase, testis isozyme [Phytophthora cactorum]|uniref:Creatine kinase, testis isozyme n=1 Tax=Phytophthora cactorum TaxID=29920 RepID=A0A8T1HIW4_9STRA|nr:Creatine kinase, testis isozyme [Phytophthora cactorum]